MNNEIFVVQFVSLIVYSLTEKDQELRKVENGNTSKLISYRHVAGGKIFDLIPSLGWSIQLSSGRDAQPSADDTVDFCLVRFLSLLPFDCPTLTASPRLTAPPLS